MSDTNKVFLTGNLTRNPELRYTPGGAAVCEFTIAVNDKYKEKETTAFVGCRAWNGTAEKIDRDCEKGTPLFVEGKISQDSWEDRETGKKQSKTKVTVFSFRVVSYAKKEDPQRPQSNQGNQQQGQRYGKEDRPDNMPPPPPEMPDEQEDDIPF